MTTKATETNALPIGASEVVLPSGKKAIIHPFKGKQIRLAQRQIAGDETKFLFVLMSMCCEIDGKFVTPEEIDEMEGRDVLALQAEFSKGNF